MHKIQIKHFFIHYIGWLTMPTTKPVLAKICWKTEEITSNTLRPTRAAAIQAREQMQKLLSSEIGTLSWLGSVAEFPQRTGN